MTTFCCFPRISFLSFVMVGLLGCWNDNTSGISSSSSSSSIRVHNMFISICAVSGASSIDTNRGKSRRGVSIQYRNALSRIRNKSKRTDPIDDTLDDLKSDGYHFSRNDVGITQDDEAVKKKSQVDDTADTTHTKNVGNPIIYRYFGRARARSVRSDSIPFIIISKEGSVDHWKDVGRILGSRGFNTIVIERVKNSKSNPPHESTTAGVIGKNAKISHQHYLDSSSESVGLVDSILDMLKWQRAILVGCDEESVLGIEAASQLAPDRVVGLILCGDLSSLTSKIREYYSAEEEEKINIEYFLKHSIECPCQVIWDGDTASWPIMKHISSDFPVTTSISKIILGSGFIPHRRAPEQFAWTLTRFVEERISTLHQLVGANLDEAIAEQNSPNRKIRWNNLLPLSQIVTPGTMLVSGRIIATTVIYICMAKAAFVQYRNIRGIQNAFLSLSKLSTFQNLFSKLRNNSWREKIFLHIRKSLFNQFPQKSKARKDKHESIELPQETQTATEEETTNEVPLESQTATEEEMTNEVPLESQTATEEEMTNELPLESQTTTEEEITPQPAEEENEQEDIKWEEIDDYSPLLQKLLFFDQIIS